MNPKSILIWLPSPMGDAIMSTPALRALRNLYEDAEIYYLANPTVRQILSPCDYNDHWLELNSTNPLKIALKLRKYNFDTAVLFKNSFASALAVFLAGIPLRAGYVRECRGLFLNHKLYPSKLPDGKYKPRSMVDYYLDLAGSLGADTTDRKLQLQVDDAELKKAQDRFCDAIQSDGPLVVFVPGGAFGLSKCWASDRFAALADKLIEKYHATVILSVAPNQTEKKIAADIQKHSSHQLISLADNPLSLPGLKALFSFADLVVANDTGPRHIAVALERKIITLFGPNDPAWTQTGYDKEIQIVGKAPCAPCHKSVCPRKTHTCMDDITVEKVRAEAEKLLVIPEKHQ